MAAEIGIFACSLAFVLAIVQMTVPMLASYKRQYYWMSLATPLSLATFVAVSLAFFVLMYAFVNNDFSIGYVASTSNSKLPLHFRVTAMWGAHEGALLLWIFILSAWSALVALFSRNLPVHFRARVLAVIGAVNVGFLSFLIFTSSPFERNLPYIPVDGNDLNPLLQDFGFIIHPPFLYMGYVGFVVAFAFSIAALLEGKLDTAIAKWTRPWTIAAWGFLTIGISLGSWWAYYELGWGGWWMWDPVENASFIPWLTGTALIHSLIVTEKRGIFKGWTLFLAVTTFSLTLLGTFLVRSGVLTSVHAFASDPVRGIYILAFLGIVVGGALILFAARGHLIYSTIGSKLESREGFMLVNNVFLSVAGLMVLLGTLYPLLYDAIIGGRVSIGEPYFDFMFSLLMSPLFVLMIAGPLMRWKSDSIIRALTEKKRVAVFTLVLNILATLAFFIFFSWPVAFAVFLTIGFLYTLGSDLAKKMRYQLSWAAFKGINIRTWTMHIAHVGLLLVVLGAILSTQFSTQKDVRLGPGKSVDVDGYQVGFLSQKDYAKDNFLATQVAMKVSKGDWSTVLYPEKRRYQVRGQVMTEAGIDPGFWRDVYVSLGEPLQQGDWAVRVYVKPFIRWVWLGTLFMGFAAILAVAGRKQ